MEPQEIVKSILAADFGAANTRVIMIELVNGQYRLVSSAKARTTLAAPHNDVSVGLLWAIEKIEAATQRILYDDDSLIFPEENGNGVDQIWITSSAGRPLTAVLLGLMPNVSINSAARAMTGTYVNVAATISVGDRRDEQTQINEILRVNPDLLFVSGGTDGGNEKAVLELVALAGLAARLAPPEERPIVIFAGNNDLVPRVQEMFAEIDTRLIIASNVRPNLMNESLGNARVELARAFSDHMARQPGGFESVSGIDIQPTAQGVASLVRWLGQDSDKVAMHLDIGSATSTLIYGNDQNVTANIYSDMGLGHSILTAVERLGYAAILDWLPFEISEAALLNYASNKVLKPDTVPQDIGEVFVELAIMRAVIREMMSDALEGLSPEVYQSILTPSPLILSGSMLTEGLHPGVAVLMALDGLEAYGAIEVYTDPYGIVPVLGSVAYDHPAVAVQVYDNHGVNYVGTVFCPLGQQTRGKVMNILITYDTGATSEHELESGQVMAIGGIVGEAVEVEIKLARGLKLNGKRRFKEKVRIGTAGLIFDGRGRPLMDIAPDKRVEAYQSWWQQISQGQAAITIPETHEMDANADDIKVRRRETDALKNAIRKAIMESEQREAVFEEIDRAAAGKRGRNQKRRGDSSDLDDLISQLE